MEHLAAGLEDEARAAGHLAGPGWAAQEREAPGSVGPDAAEQGWAAGTVPGLVAAVAVEKGLKVKDLVGEDLAAPGLERPDLAGQKVLGWEAWGLEEGELAVPGLAEPGLAAAATAAVSSAALVEVVRGWAEQGWGTRGLVVLGLGAPGLQAMVYAERGSEALGWVGLMTVAPGTGEQVEVGGGAWAAQAGLEQVAMVAVARVARGLEVRKPEEL